ncbi:hypothetical protein NDU88_002908 [Pleurodeles waltl]|uniref:Uncharacterized protein n=1 Tax=Pleurodeles waltl TaxID=8319 RepID=A0AAV7M1Z4_PLEWA|nr:hypothetical protein NDU88_002908 [Pleurodeles waltl]
MQPTLTRLVRLGSLKATGTLGEHEAFGWRAAWRYLALCARVLTYPLVLVDFPYLTLIATVDSGARLVSKLYL